MSERKGEFFSATSDNSETPPGGEIEVNFDLFLRNFDIKRGDTFDSRDAEEVHDILRQMQQELWALVQFLKNERYT
jgi:hypothetical protein